MASLVLQFVAYGGYSTVGQTFYMDAFDQIGGSQYTLRHVLHFPPTSLQIKSGSFSIAILSFIAWLCAGHSNKAIT